MDPNDLRERTTPDGLAPLLLAMWHARREDWAQAHEITQAIDTREAAWVHAYLHRQEGDLGNAQYWYQRAGKALPKLTLASEWEEIVRAF